MNILFMARALGYGGAERQLTELAKGLRARGHAVAVAVFYAGGPFEEELRAAGVGVHRLDKAGRWDVLGFLRRLAALLRRERPEVVHGYLLLPNVLATLSKLVLPGVRVVWGVRDSDVGRDRYDRLERLLYALACRLARFADLIVSNSRAGLTHAVARGFPPAKMLVIPNGVDGERFVVDREAGRRVRDGWRVGVGETLVGLVGRLDPLKDHGTFLEAAAALARERPGLRFVCVGGGSEGHRTELARRAEGLGLGGALVWEGARADMPAVYNALDLLVSSSLSEGFPNVLVEAMACGVPVVATDAGDSAWIVGGLGRLVRRSDPAALKDGMAAALERICARGGGGAGRAELRRGVLGRFSLTELVARSESALARLGAGEGESYD